jgi:hypothetical protein
VIVHALCFTACGLRRAESFRVTDSLCFNEGVIMVTQIVPLAAAGYSLLYLLFGGGLGGAIIIFIVAKMLGK